VIEGFSGLDPSTLRSEILVSSSERKYFLGTISGTVSPGSVVSKETSMIYP
jgi:hypothetical protein